MKKLVLFSLALSGCHNLSILTSFSKFEAYCFEKSGSAIFSNPISRQTKEIHLEGAGLNRQEVMLVGTIKDLNGEKTFFSLVDREGEILIDLTQYYDMTKNLDIKPGETVRILGSVKNGGNRLPFISARALTKIKG